VNLGPAANQIKRSAFTPPLSVKVRGTISAADYIVVMLESIESEEPTFLDASSALKGTSPSVLPT